MIQEFTGNLFDYIVREELNIIIHGCNAQGKMNSGFAKELRERHPEAYNAYYNQYATNGLQLGTNVYYYTNDNVIVANAITQEFYGTDGKKYVDYDAVKSCFADLNTFEELTSTQTVNVCFPKIGAGLAGGDWDTISAIIDSTLSDKFNKKLYIL